MRSHTEILNELLSEKVIAILRADSGDVLVEACQALVRGGIRAVEITMTVPNALEILKEVRDRMGNDVLLGAGSVLDPETARLVILAGAEYVVSPHTDAEIIRLARRYGKPVMPGAFTPTEVVQAWQAGADIVKIFPSDGLGPQHLKALKAPLPQIRMMPTGGVNLKTMPDFFAAGACAVGVGSSLVKQSWLTEKNFAAIEAEAKNFAQVVQEMKDSTASK